MFRRATSSLSKEPGYHIPAIISASARAAKILIRHLLCAAHRTLKVTVGCSAGVPRKKDAIPYQARVELRVFTVPLLLLSYSRQFCLN